MHCELVRTTTSDGFRLDGALYRAPKPPSFLDAVVCLHGVGGNFYSSTLQEALLAPLHDLGIAVLRVNTRGHDGLTIISTNAGPSRQGAAYEVVDHCRYDVAAWLDFLGGQNYGRIALLGHSLGAIKAVYSQAYEPHPLVQAIVALSPPRLSYENFLASAQADKFRESYEEAQRKIEAGRPEKLIQVRFPFPLVITAAGYVEKYGPAERYNLLKFAHRVRRPTLYVYGTRELEQGASFAGVPEALQGLSHRVAPEVALIDGADHFYTGLHAAMVERVCGWLAGLRPE